MFFGITLILLSLLAVPSLILSKRPDAEEVLAKIAPYQGWIGLVFCIYGVWGIISSILGLSMITTYPIWWATMLASSVVEASLGFLLGYSIINKYILSKSEESMKKGQELLLSLSPVQGKLGLLGLAVGAWTIVASILFF